MAHEYSVEIQDFITEKLIQIDAQIKKATQENDSQTLRFCDGQKEELSSLRRYLSENMDLDTQKYY